jgi:hypothetical protein
MQWTRVEAEPASILQYLMMNECEKEGGQRQRWASTLANRSNARHRSNIRAPHAPSPQIYVSKVWESGAGRDS